MSSLKFVTNVVCAFLLLVEFAYADEKQHLNHKDNVAVQGYDVVAYFAGQVKKGALTITSEYQGLTYRFHSRDNKVLFDADRSKYAPQYGGWCATAMAKGDKVAINPKSYKVTDGKLYLFYKGLFGNALKAWKKDEANLIVKADAAWAKIIAD